MLKACLHGDVDEVRRLLKEGQDPTEKDEKMVTPLMLASTNSPAIVKILLQNKAVRDTINDCDNVNYSSLHYAARFDQHDVVYALLDAGADFSIEATDGVSSTPIEIAYRYRHVRCIQAFNDNRRILA